MSKSVSPGMPRWVKVSGLLLAAALLLMMVSGHGPWRHWAGNGTAWYGGHGGEEPSSDTLPKAGQR
jgi:hypothetical protein